MIEKLLRKSIIEIIKQDSLLTHSEISKALKTDKAIVSGYLQAMVDYGEISMKKIGNSKVYFIEGKNGINV